MRYINELIGVIKGIGSDGIITDIDFTRLQNWVDRNRNIAYEPKQVELVKTVDKVLQKHVVTEDEKRNLIVTAEYYLNEIGDNTNYVYELNRIIKIIISDRKVKEAEIIKLTEWMNSYGHLIKDDQQTRDLWNAIDSIIANKTATNEELKQVLEMLKQKINSAQFETKLEHLCGLVKEKKNIGIELIDLINNESAMIEVHRRAEKKLLMSLASVSGVCSKPEIIVVSLVLIAMLEYDGNYYGNVRATYTHVYDRYSEQKVEGLIRSILGRYKKNKDSATRTRIINVALENAIVPQVFLPAFFDFIFDIYKLNFDYDLPEDPYEDFEFVFEGLRTNMLSDGDDISINVTQKTYKLTAATKQLIVKEDGVDAVIKLSILIAKLIDKRFWDKEVKIYNPYLKAGYERWESQLAVNSGGKNDKRGSIGESSNELRSRWEPKLVFKNNAVYLFPPAHRIKAQYDYRRVAVVVLNDEIELYKDTECDIREIIGGFQVNSHAIEVDNPLGKLKYRLQCGNEIIYDSKEIFYRNYMVFNEEGQEISNNTDFQGTAFICYKPGEADLQTIISKENYCIGYKIIRQGDAINVGKDVFNFSSLIRPGVFGKLHNKCFVCTGGSNNIPVFKEINVIAFEADNISTKFEININGKSHKLSEMKYTCTARGNVSKYVVEPDIITSGIYSVEVNQLVSGKKNKVLKEEFVYDKELTFKSESIDKCRVGLTLNSGIIDKTLYTVVSAQDEEPGYIYFNYKGDPCAFVLPLDLGFYSIDGNSWRSTENDIWIDDITYQSKMKLFDSQCDGLLVYTENGVLVEDNIAICDKGIYKEVSIGFLKSYQNNNNYTMLVFTVAEKKRHVVFCYNKCIMDSENTEIVCSDNPKQIKLTPVYHGGNNVFIEIFNKCGEKVFTSKTLKSEETEIVDGFNSFEEYIINFHEKTKLLTLRKNSLLLSVKKVFYARQDYVGRTFKIINVYFDQYIGKDRFEKEYYFNKSYLKITRIKEDGVFEGDIIVRTYRGEWVLDKISPVEIEICSEIVDDTMDVYITNAGDGLLLDFEKHGIMNSLDHPTAPDIFLYTLSLKGD